MDRRHFLGISGTMGAMLSGGLPLWRNHVVDREFGGYIPQIDSYFNGNGEMIQSDKRMYHQGRCFWFYSYLYNHVEKDAHFLEAATQGYEFLVKYAFEEESSLWRQRVNRQGDELIPHQDILASVYMFMGLGEHSSESWLVEWFDRSFTYAYETGKIRFPYGETLHHPRGLLFSIEILDRMIDRDGQKSDFLETSVQPQEKRNYR